MKTKIALLTIFAAAACGPDLGSDAKPAATDQQRADGLAAVMDYANREMFAEFPPTAVAHAAGLGADDATAIAEYADRYDLLFTQTEICVTGEESVCQRVGPGSHRWVRVGSCSRHGRWITARHAGLVRPDSGRGTGHHCKP